MQKLLGILPYIYFFEEPVHLGDVRFIGVPDWQGRQHAPEDSADRESLQELFTCFPAKRGIVFNTGAKRAMTYFLLAGRGRKDEEILKESRKAITLLRYALLRPNTQALDNVESTYLYAFALPPMGSTDYRLYQCWPNINIEQEIWVSPENQKFPLPGWYVDFKLLHTSQLEDIEEIKQRFYRQGKLDWEDEAILAIDWYNQSFLRYSMSNIPRRLVDISIAFETLFQLQKNNITFKEALTQTLEATQEPALEHWAGSFYGRIRSATTHSGKPASLLYQHSDAQTPHISFLWSAQRIFRECVSVRLGLPRHISNDRLVEELVPNEIHLRKLKEASSYCELLKRNLLEEVDKLKPIHPVGEREDIIWLGRVLLQAYKERFLSDNEQNLPTLDVILDSEDTGTRLGVLYTDFLKEFEPVYFRYITFLGEGDELREESNKLKPVPMDNFEQIQLENAVYHFAAFASFALLFPPKM